MPKRRQFASRTYGSLLDASGQFSAVEIQPLNGARATARRQNTAKDEK